MTREPARRRRGAIAVAALSGVALASAAGLTWWRASGIGPVERGRRLAQQSGCFGCHGPGGATGFEDPGNRVGVVPALTAEELPQYAESPAELRQWIADGAPQRIRDEPAAPGSQPEQPPLLQMPAFGDVLSPQQIDDLVAWLGAVAGFDAPDEAEAAGGRRAAQRLGCFACHGPGGRGELPNPGSLRGRIPAWDGADFSELVRDEGELREWVLDGAPARLREHPIASGFLSRQAVRMPAYRERIESAELDALVTYVAWLRKGRPTED